MIRMRRWIRYCGGSVLGLFLFLSLALFPSGALAENIDPDNDGSQFAWSQNFGWLNAEPGSDGGLGVQVEDEVVTGFLWSSRTGWISLSCENFQLCVQGREYGVTNDGLGVLSGYAWSGVNIGWISFSCKNTDSCDSNPWGVTIDPKTGEFSGFAWNSNTGWISFRNSPGSTPYGVTTSWRPPVVVMLSPEKTTNPVGTAHTVLATVSQGGVPLSGTNVAFSVTGVNSSGGTTVTTDENGNATIIYTGLGGEGTDIIRTEVVDSSKMTVVSNDAEITWMVDDVVFAAFNIDRARIELHGRDDKDHDDRDRDRRENDRFEIRGSFLLGDGEDGNKGVNLPQEAVTITVGGFSVQVPPNTLVRNKYDNGFKLPGELDGLMKLVIKDDGRFRIKGRGVDLQIGNRKDPVNFELRIGNDVGTAVITRGERDRSGDHDDKDHNDD